MNASAVAAGRLTIAGLLLYLTWPVKFAGISAQRRRAIAELSRMDHRHLKDLGFPTRLQVETMED
jgi:hypothetical protein